MSDQQIIVIHDCSNCKLKLDCSRGATPYSCIRCSAFYCFECMRFIVYGDTSRRPLHAICGDCAKYVTHECTVCHNTENRTLYECRSCTKLICTQYTCSMSTFRLRSFICVPCEYRWLKTDDDG